FICDIIDYLPKGKLAHKYKNELHANEVAILPYYISNLNIEYTYKQKMGAYAEFDNLCFVDTLDNTGFHWVGKQGDLFGVSAENAQRIKRQNERKISVVIGNPPYNANQANENDNNKNREYWGDNKKKTGGIDGRIKETFIKYSTAQKTKLYDMYSRFYRWAMDRLTDNGIIAFISNRSFIDSRTFDGFRKTIQQDFDHAYIIDTRSDVRANPKIAGTTHNVFGIQTGVAILFLVKSTHKQIKANPCHIEYTALDDFWRKEEKLAWFAENNLQQIEFDNITPDKNNNWINLGNNDWESLISVADKKVKNGKSKQSIFELFFAGVPTNRDEWVYDFDKENLTNKMSFFSVQYNFSISNNIINEKIKWSRDLKNELKRKNKSTFDSRLIIKDIYRPFVKVYQYTEKILNDVLTKNHYEVYGSALNLNNLVICIPGVGIDRPYHVIGIDCLPHLQITPNGQCLPLYRYTSTGERIDNITAWGLQQFKDHYNKEKTPIVIPTKEESGNTKNRSLVPRDDKQENEITKEDIFHYTYAVLHNPAYRKKYELNLKREFPRIPFYENFFQWREWGKQLMNLHINYETVDPFPLSVIARRATTKQSPEQSTHAEEIATPSLKARNDEIKPPKAKLKAIKESGIIQLDENTELHGIAKEAWEYKLGNRSALEWILDQYKEKKPTDPTIAEKFNTYKFADYKDKVIELLKRVCTVSVETMRIVKEMEKV
ncbi:MAG: Eco57I restriction-modification methylase domain-containing protein, partial [Bacteroidota bacterium]|nr:Eco57I restriction-modification methylase domain-containing protein [Bacteroidota bacterium]